MRVLITKGILAHVYFYIQMESTHSKIHEIESLFWPLPSYIDDDSDASPIQSDTDDEKYEEEEEEEPFTPDHGAFFEEYLMSLLNDSPLTLNDSEETPENSVIISFSNNVSNVRRSLFRQ